MILRRHNLRLCKNLRKEKKSFSPSSFNDIRNKNNLKVTSKCAGYCSTWGTYSVPHTSLQSQEETPERTSRNGKIFTTGDASIETWKLSGTTAKKINSENF